MADPVVTEDYLAATLDETADGLSGQREFDVLGASLFDAKNALTQAGVYRGGAWRDAHGEIPLPVVLCRNVRFRVRTPAPLGGVGLFRAVAVYGDLSDGGGRQRAEPGGPPVYEWVTGIIDGYATVDRNGNRLVNSLGQGLRVPYREAVPVLQVTWFRDSKPSESLIYVTETSINAADYHGIPAGKGMCTKLRSSSVATASADADGYYLMRAEFTANKRGWNPRPYDEGFQEKFADPFVPGGAPILGADGVPGASRSELTPLGSDGKFLPASGTPLLLPEVDQYEPRNWASDWGI